MIDLEAIKARRAAVGPGSNWTVEDGKNFINHAPADIDALVAEVERLERTLDLCEVGLTPTDVDEAPDDLQRCGHPHSAIATDSSGVPYALCEAEAEAEVRRDDRLNTDPELREPLEMREEEVRY